MKKILSFSFALAILTASLSLTALATKDVGPVDLFYAMKAADSTSVRLFATRDTNGKFGFTNPYGQWVIPAKYTYTTDFLADGYGTAKTEDGQNLLINSEGEQVFNLGSAHRQLVTYGNVNLGNGVVHISGKVIVPFIGGSTITPYENGKYYIRRYGQIVYEGKEATTQMFDYTGKNLFPDKVYTNIEYMGPDRVMLYTGKSSGWATSDSAAGYTGAVLADFSGKRYPLTSGYDKKNLGSFPFAKNGLAFVTFSQYIQGKDSRQYYAIINKSGNVTLAEKEYTMVTQTLDKGYFFGVQWNSSKGVMVDTSGKITKNFKGNTVEALTSNNLLLVTGGEKDSLYTTNLVALALPTDYYAYDHADSDFIYYGHSGSDFATAVLDKNGKRIIAAEKGEITRINNYFRRAVTAGSRDVVAYKYYNLNGQLVYNQPREETYTLSPQMKGNRTVLIETTALGQGIAPLTNTTKATAKPSATKIEIQGRVYALEAYNIGGNNYMKLRDVAAVLSETDKRFEVRFDPDKQAIIVATGQAYTSAGGEMTQGDGKEKQAVTSTNHLYIDGAFAKLKAYTIGGNNFYKLRDLMAALNVYVGYNSASATATLDPAISYDSFIGGIAYIKPGDNNRVVVDISAESMNAGAKALLWNDEAKANQCFYFQKSGDKYRILATHSNLPLSAKGGELVQANTANDPAQLFAIKHSGGGLYQISNSDGLYLTLAGTAQSGTALHFAPATGDTNQQFRFS